MGRIQSAVHLKEDVPSKQVRQVSSATIQDLCFTSVLRVRADATQTAACESPAQKCISLDCQTAFLHRKLLHFGAFPLPGRDNRIEAEAASRINLASSELGRQDEVDLAAGSGQCCSLPEAASCAMSNQRLNRSKPRSNWRAASRCRSFGDHPLQFTTPNRSILFLYRLFDFVNHSPPGSRYGIYFGLSCTIDLPGEYL
jgi:hypothetical protein